MNMVNGILNQENIELKYILDERQLKAVQEHSWIYPCRIFVIE